MSDFNPSAPIPDDDIDIAVMEKALAAAKEKKEKIRLAREEAARIAREEADRLAREEAERKAEEERLAKEEAERKAEEERFGQGGSRTQGSGRKKLWSRQKKEKDADCREGWPKVVGQSSKTVDGSDLGIEVVEGKRKRVSTKEVGVGEAFPTKCGECEKRGRGSCTRWSLKGTTCEGCHKAKVRCSHTDRLKGGPRKRMKKDGGEGSVAGSSTEFEDAILDRLDRIEARFDQLVRLLSKGKGKAKEETEDEEDEEEDDDEDVE
ncbi:hypothetical protein BT96DRAFT_978610 [Gymnopus androsaceus JB14]|uniref:Uncharacterized protein n=1 Tax=Gymnopus androsaceus JB14 TaxID=1447944 RepID=A0A6A4H8A3_9AGAR|nr:hypothetical protein BT96DRAFT_978610 [Gymnopus androsaceus JB14]